MRHADYPDNVAMTISCHLHFDGQCERAFRKYQSILGGEITLMLSFSESPLAAQVPPEWQSRIIHANLVVDGQEFLGSDAFPDGYEKPQGFSVTLNISEFSRASEVFAGLAENGVVKMPFQATFWSPGFGVLVDEFGVPWEVNCVSALA